MLPPQYYFKRKETACPDTSFIPICVEREAVDMVIAMNDVMLILQRLDAREGTMVRPELEAVLEEMWLARVLQRWRIFLL